MHCPLIYKYVLMHYTTSVDTNITLQAKLFKGLADQSRLAILETLLDGPKTVSDIVKATKLSQPNTSTHLACLLECALVQREKEGREVRYSVSTKDVRTILQGVKKILKTRGKEIYECTRY